MGLCSCYLCDTVHWLLFSFLPCVLRAEMCVTWLVFRLFEMKLKEAVTTDRSPLWRWLQVAWWQCDSNRLPRMKRDIRDLRIICGVGTSYSGHQWQQQCGIENSFFFNFSKAGKLSLHRRSTIFDRAPWKISFGRRTYVWTHECMHDCEVFNLCFSVLVCNNNYSNTRSPLFFFCFCLYRFALPSMFFKNRNIRQLLTQPLSEGCSHISG